MHLLSASRVRLYLSSHGTSVCSKGVGSVQNPHTLVSSAGPTQPQALHLTYGMKTARFRRCWGACGVGFLHPEPVPGEHCICPARVLSLEEAAAAWTGLARVPSFTSWDRPSGVVSSSWGRQEVHMWIWHFLQKNEVCIGSIIAGHSSHFLQELLRDETGV